MPARTAADRGREVRLQLLSAAAELIAELGWNAVSTRILAERAGVTPGLVHYHFPSLQALLRDAALGMISDLLSATELIFEDARTLDAGVDLMLGSLDAYTGRDLTPLLFTETYLAATRDETLRIELIALVEEFRRKLAGWLGEHGANAPHDTASVLAAAINGVMLHRALNPELTSSAIAPVLRRLVFPGTATPFTAAPRSSCVTHSSTARPAATALERGP
ncbi:MAG TPA: TetR/AcrR family transcriptional regulator [Pseudonocardiaceae bacterium]|jgi:AcrR family transcriptional regulator|nr:TetR/AcrR family transcriptional regulator [Pseudonocardiaceae bacterium]